MPHAVTVTTLSENQTKLVVHVLIESDGSTGELVNYPIVDPASVFSTFQIDPRTTDASGPPYQLTINQIWHSQAWCDILLRFNALVPSTGWVIARDSDNYNDFRYFGGIKDRTTTESDGKILITTNGLDGISGAVATFVLDIKKN